MLPRGYEERSEADQAEIDRVMALARKDGNTDSEHTFITNSLTELTKEGTLEQYPTLARESERRIAASMHFRATRPFTINVAEMSLRLLIVACLTGAAVWALKTPCKETPAG